jgi:membrane protein CcdC involved in cytochrome C biogenesis
MQVPATLMRPRTVPGRFVPAVAGGGLLVFALPVFFVAGWNLKAWLLAAVVWAASEGLGLLLGRLRVGMDNVGSSGVVAFGMMLRAIVVMVVLIAVAASNKHLGLTAALLYAAAYTMQLGVSLVTFFSAPEKQR